MKRIKNRKIIRVVILIIVILTLIFIPKPVYVEFNEPKLPSELLDLFHSISIKNISVQAMGTNYSGGGVVDHLHDVEIMLKDLKESNNDELIRIISIEFYTSGADLLYLITHKNEFDIANYSVLTVILGRVEDQIERLISH